MVQPARNFNTLLVALLLNQRNQVLARNRDSHQTLGRIHCIIVPVGFGIRKWQRLQKKPTQGAEEAAEAIRSAEEAEGQPQEAEALLKACEAMTGPEIHAEIERIRTSVQDWRDEARAEVGMSKLKALRQYRAWLADPAEKARRRRDEILQELEWQRVEAAKDGAIGRWAVVRVGLLMRELMELEML